MNTMKIIFTIFFAFFLSWINAQTILTDNLGVLKAKIENNDTEIEILNEDGTTWMKFDFAFEKKLSGKSSYTLEDIKRLYQWQENFYPYFFKIDYAIVLLKCTEVEEDKYKVVVNEKTGEEKYIKKKDIWKLESWSEHILKTVVSVDFDYAKNPIKDLPDSNSSNLKTLDEIEGLHIPLDIKEDWLKVQVIDENGEHSGWIKWRDENKIIINLYYLI